VVRPRISFAFACFVDNQYEDQATQQCFSNLLAMGFRRFSIDLYLDADRNFWSLCPAQFPPAGKSSSSSTMVSLASSSARVLSNAQLSTEIGVHNENVPRTASPTTSRVGASLTTTQLTTPSPKRMEFLPRAVEDDALVHIGNVACTKSIGLGTLTEVLSGYFMSTADTLNAALVYLDLNLHVAAGSSSNPGQVFNESNMLSGANIISNIINVNLSSYIYSPANLNQDRHNLNTTWLTVDPLEISYANYYDIDIQPGGISTTPNGWPTETYVEFKRGLRLIVSFDVISPEVEGYNFTADANTIFPSNFTSSLVSESWSDGGTPTHCFFNPSIVSMQPETNSSWAFSPDLLTSDNLGASNETISVLENLTSCGVSPFINQSLANGTTAERNIAPFSIIAQSTIWSWAPGEPSNSSVLEGSNTATRCAGFIPSLNGRWKATDCASKYRAACRYSYSPYAWTMTSSRYSFSDAVDQCPGNSSFAVPRTALENTYLLAAARSFLSSLGRDADDNDADDRADEPIFLNFQSLVTPDCWVVGVNATCPYSKNADEVRTRTVVVPTVAAVIVFAVAALTFFVKCAANRRNARRRRRRKHGGERGDYEGVPA
jgi:hypothetical protein